MKIKFTLTQPIEKDFMRISGRYKKFCTSKIYHIKSSGKNIRFKLEAEADNASDFKKTPNLNSTPKIFLPGI